MVSHQVLRPSMREVLVEQGAVQPLDDAIGLRPADAGALVRDALELEEQRFPLPRGEGFLGAVAVKGILLPSALGWPRFDAVSWAWGIVGGEHG